MKIQFFQGSQVAYLGGYLLLERIAGNIQFLQIFVRAGVSGARRGFRSAPGFPERAGVSGARRGFRSTPVYLLSRVVL
jgi:hypothetical protein